MNRPHRFRPLAGRALSTILVVGVVIASVASSPAAAQSARRTIRAGEVTGLELGLEGATVGVRGHTLTWLVTAYEVVGLDQLRPAAGARVRVATSLEGVDSLALTTDRRGRAIARIPIPGDAPGSFGVSLRIHSPRGVQRTFRLPVRTRLPERLELLLPVTPQRGGDLPVVAFVKDFDAAAEEQLQLTLLTGDRVLAGPVAVVPGEGGMATHVFPAVEESSLLIRAELARPSSDGGEGLRWVSERSMNARAPASVDGLVVQLAPARLSLGPATEVEVEVQVRTPRGRPVADALVGFDASLLRLTSDPNRVARAVSERRLARTDARGRATLLVETPRLQGNQFRDHGVAVHAQHPTLGAGNGQATLRVHTRPYYAQLVAENGALVPEVPGRVAVRVVDALGAPAPAGVRVQLGGPRFDPTTVETGADGYALVPLTLRAGADPRCGGESGAQVHIELAGGFAEDRCLPVDVDALVRPFVEDPHPLAGQPVGVRVDRRGPAGSLDVALTFFGDPSGADPSAVAALDQVIVPARTRRIEWTPPPGFAGPVAVRARALSASDARELRGGYTAFILAAPHAAPRLQGSVQGQRDALVVSAETDAPQLLAIALPRSLAPTWRTALPPHSPAARIFQLATTATGATPADITAPSVWRGEIVPAPAPENPELRGLLRDPWRTRDRFVEGRLGLVFQALEHAVDASVPGPNLREVAVRRGERLVFHQQVLATLGDDALGAEGATGLGGEPLELRTLEGLDRDVNFDSVARRVTRRRLLRLLVALRGFVVENGLDLEWTRRGDPTLWLDSLPGRWVGDAGLEARELADAWGRAFVLRRVSRPRFDRVQPVAGYELVSAGPDGRVGNGDDLFDPTAPVLDVDGIYGRAVGEAALVARLRGVELGRATLAAVASAMGSGMPGVPYRVEERVATPQFALPSELHAPIDPLAFEAVRNEGAVHLSTIRGGSATIAIDDRPQRWSVLLLGFDGEARTTRLETFAGVPLLVEGALPRRSRVGEEITLDLSITNASTSDLDLQVGAEASAPEGSAGALEARVASPDVHAPAGRAVRVPLSLVGRDAGRVALALSLSRGAELQRRVVHEMQIDEGGHPLRQVRATLAALEGTRELEIDVPRDARRVRSRAIVVGPRALASDPELAALREAEPALLAWSAVLSGHEVSDESIRALTRVVGEGAGAWGPIRFASTLVVASALAGRGGDEGAVASSLAQARARAERQLWNANALPDDDPLASGLRADAIRLVLLSGGDEASPSTAARARLRTALRRVPARPGLLARAAAALLLADPRDVHGRAMLEQAAVSLDDGRIIEEGDATDELRATLALALAAHAAADEGLRERALDHAARWLTRLRGDDPEAVAYWFALGATGALGEGSLGELEVQGHRERVEDAPGMRAITIEAEGGDELSVEVPAGPTRRLVRLESVYARPFTAREDAPVTLSIVGPVGEVGATSGMRLEVRATRDLEHVVVEIRLPTGIALDDAWRGALRGARSIDERDPGFLRIELGPLRERAAVAVPLNFRWRAGYARRGLAAVAYEPSRPDRMSVLPARELAPEEPRWSTDAR